MGQAIPSRSRSDSAASGAQWKQFYEFALLELNPQRLPATDEHVALNSALRILPTLEEMAAKEAADYHAA